MTDWVSAIERHLEAQQVFAVATVVAGPDGVGSKLLLLADGSCEGQIVPAGLQVRILADVPALVEREETTTLTYDEHEVFIQVFSPQPRLVVVGAVHTAIPLISYARILGFRTIVVDGRARFATRERFPEADELIVGWPDEVLPGLQIGQSTYVVILTHDPKFDLPALRALAGRGARYVGAMGSRQTRRNHMDQLRAEGVPDEFIRSVYGPVGLELGARTPEEIALSIMAEIVAVRYGARGGHKSS